MDKVSLLHFPSEIRNIIYEMVLPMDSRTEISAIKLRKLQVKQHRKTATDESVPNIPILYVNRQIHHEAVHILYHNAQFIFNVGSGVGKFLGIIGTENASFLRHVIIRTDLFAIENDALLECLIETLGVSQLPSRLTIENKQGVFGDQKIPKAFWYKGNRYLTYIELLCIISAALQSQRNGRIWKLFNKSGNDGLDLDDFTILNLTLVSGQSNASDGVEVDFKSAIEKVLDSHRDSMFRHLIKVGREGFMFKQFDRLGIEYDAERRIY